MKKLVDNDETVIVSFRIPRKLRDAFYEKERKPSAKIREFIISDLGLEESNDLELFGNKN